MLLDTDVLIDLLRARPPAVAWWSGLTDMPPVSGIAALEVLFGARDRDELRRVQAFLAPLPLLWPEAADAQQAADLAPLYLSHGIGLLDCLSAALALRHGEPLATFNVRHFAAVPRLDTVQPYIR